MQPRAHEVGASKGADKGVCETQNLFGKCTASKEEAMKAAGESKRGKWCGGAAKVLGSGRLAIGFRRLLEQPYTK